ncbi:MAG: phage tail protein [Actinomycetales bacterium]|nr:phage tail protein [Actinomycetales bacterium]
MSQVVTPTGVRTDDWLVNQLPAAMVADDFFARFVRIFQAQGSTLLVHADNVANLVDPAVAPPALVRWLTGWIGATGVDPSYPDEVHRAVLRQASASLQWRGTRRGLAELLDLVTNGTAQVSESGGVWPADEAPDGAPWVRIEAEASTLLAEADFVELVLDALPANVTAEIVLGGRRVWPHPEEDGTTR